MPRGVYDRSKASKKVQKTAKSNVTKTAKTAKTVNKDYGKQPQKPTQLGTAGSVGGADYSLVKAIHSIRECTEILTQLTALPGLEEAKEGMRKLLTGFVKEATRAESSVAMTLPEKVAENLPSMLAAGHMPPAPTKPFVYHNSAAAPVGNVKLKKDGTPKQRPGPKPKATEAVAATAPTTTVTAAPTEPTSNGKSTGDVFNPEHAAS